MASVILTLFLALVNACVCVPAYTTPRPCANGYAHGTIVNNDRYWYECQDGQLMQKGCLSKDLRRLELWESYDDQGVRVKCVLNEQGYLAFAYQGCVHNNKEYGANEEWQEKDLSYLCKKEQDSVQVQVSGCVDKEGNKVPLDERVVKGEYVYECRKLMDGSYNIIRVGCFYDGRNYNVGEKFVKSNRVYVCNRKRKGGEDVVLAQCTGCVYSDQKLGDRDEIIQDEVVYACNVNGERTKMIPVACVAKENGVAVHKKLNCTWVEGESPYRYEVLCKTIENTNAAIKLQMRCSYEVRGGAYVIDPGCYVVADGSAIGCVRKQDGGLEIRSFHDIVQAASTLKYC